MPGPAFGRQAGLLSVIQMSYEGATIKKSLFASLTRYFFCPLPEASFARGHKKIPHSVQDFFIVPFAGLSSNELYNDLLELLKK